MGRPIQGACVACIFLHISSVFFKTGIISRAMCVRYIFGSAVLVYLCCGVLAVKTMFSPPCFSTGCVPSGYANPNKTIMIMFMICLISCIIVIAGPVRIGDFFGTLQLRQHHEV